MTESGPLPKPRLPTPPGACDTHMHIYHPEYAPLPGANFPALPATVEDYRKLRARLGLTRSVVVQPTAYGADHRCTLMAMQALATRAAWRSCCPPIPTRKSNDCTNSACADSDTTCCPAAA